MKDQNLNYEHIRETIVSLYLQVSVAAQQAHDLVLCKRMISAAYDEARFAVESLELKTVVNLAELLLTVNSTRQAEELFNFVMKFKRDLIHSDWLQARIYDGLTEIHLRRSDFQKARKKCEQALSIVINSPNSDLNVMISRMRKLALINLHQGNSEHAHALLRQVDKLTRDC